MAGDTYWSSVVLLLSCDGADGSTTFTDTSNSGHTVTRQGDAQIDTAQSKWGGASALFDGTGDYLSIPDSADWAFGSGSWTIEAWIYSDGTPAENKILLQQRAGDGGTEKAFAFYLSPTLKLNLDWSTDGTATTTNTSNSSITASAWVHVAVVRSGASGYFFIDGVKDATTISFGSASLYNSSANLAVGGRLDGGRSFDGWMDDIRITKAARYTDTFSAPTAAFVNGPELVAAASTQANQSATGFIPGYFIAATSTQANQSASAALTKTYSTVAATATQKNQAGTGVIDQPLYSCFYGYYARTQGEDYLYRALPGSPNTRKWTFATRLYVPAGLTPDYNTICTWRQGNTPGEPDTEFTIQFMSAAYVDVMLYDGSGPGSIVGVHTSDALTRDAWHDIVVHWDSPNPVEAERVRIYVDGARAAQSITAGYPAQNQESFGGTVVPTPYVVIAGYSLDDQPDYSNTAGFADTLFLSGRNVAPAACHDYCGGYGTADWHLRYQTSSVGTDTSGNGYDFTEAGAGDWIEPESDLCLQFNFPVEVARVFPVTIGLPIHINLESAVSTISLPIQIGTYPVTVSIPININVPTAVSTVSLPIHIYGDLETESASDFIHWRPKVVLDGTDISTKMIGGIDIESEEMAAPIASFSFIPADGTVDPLAYVGKAVALSWQRMVGGVLTNTQLRFTGVVSDPTWDADQRILSITATSDLQSRMDRLSKDEIDDLLAAAAPTFSEYVFGPAEDLSGWEYAEASISTTNYVLWQDAAGVIRLSSTLAKASADFTFTEADILADSLGDSPQYPSRMDLVNRITIDFGYRFDRRRERRVTFRFRDVDLDTPSTYLSGNLGGWDLPQRSQIESAATSGGWVVIGDISYTPVWPNALYSTYSDQGTAMMSGLSIKPEVAAELCTGAVWVGAKRWVQKVTETATITVNASESQAVIGVLADNESYSIEDPASADDWETNEDYTGYVSGATLMSNGVDKRADLDTVRDDFEEAQEVAVLKAKNDILRAHRGTTVTFASPFLAAIDLSHTVEIDTAWLECKGKVRRITDRWDIDSGDCTTSVEIALYRHNGSGLTADTPVEAIEKADDPDETAPTTLVNLGLHIGGQDDRPEWDESFTGYVVNLPFNPDLGSATLLGSWSRNPANPQVAPRIYDPGFHVVPPTIDASYADPSNAAATAAIEVAIPEDPLVITSG